MRLHSMDKPLDLRCFAHDPILCFRRELSAQEIGQSRCICRSQDRAGGGPGCDQSNRDVLTALLQECTRAAPQHMQPQVMLSDFTGPALHDEWRPLLLDSNVQESKES